MLKMFNEHQANLSIEQFLDASTHFGKVTAVNLEHMDTIGIAARRLMSVSLEAFEVAPYTGKKAEETVDKDEDSQTYEGEAKEATPTKLKERLKRLWEKIKTMFFKALNAVKGLLKNVIDKTKVVINKVRAVLRKAQYGDKIGVTPQYMQSKFEKFAKGWNLPTTKIDVMMKILTGEIELDILPSKHSFVNLEAIFRNSSDHLSYATETLLKASDKIAKYPELFKDGINEFLRYLKSSIGVIIDSPGSGFVLQGVDSVKDIDGFTFTEVRLVSVKEEFTDKDRAIMDKKGKPLNNNIVTSFFPTCEKFTTSIDNHIKNLLTVEAHLEECGVRLKKAQNVEWSEEAGRNLTTFYQATGVTFNVYQARLKLVENSAKIAMLLGRFSNEFVEGYRKGE